VDNVEKYGKGVKGCLRTCNQRRMTTGIHIIGLEKFIPTESRDRCAFVMHPKDKIKEKAS
jgi:hypothetical protein